MVWRDADFGVDAPSLTELGAWETMQPLVTQASSVRYENDLREGATTSC